MRRIWTWLSKLHKSSISKMMDMDDEELGAKYRDVKHNRSISSIPWEVEQFIGNRKDLSRPMHDLLADVFRQNIFNYDDTEIGRLMKILLPVYSMKKENIPFTEENYPSLEERFQLDEQIRTFRNDVVSCFARKRVDAMEEDVLRLKNAVMNIQKQLKNEEDSQDRILADSADYMRLRNAARKLDESKASLVNIINRR